MAMAVDLKYCSNPDTFHMIAKFRKQRESNLENLPSYIFSFSVSVYGTDIFPLVDAVFK